MTTATSEPGWRPLTAAETTALRETRLGGPLAVMFWAAAIIVAIPFAAAAAFAAAAGPGGLFFALGNFLSGSDAGLSGTVFRLSLVPQVMIWTWAVVFVALTLVRSAAAPRAASVFFVLWAVLSATSQVAIRIAIARGGGIGVADAFQLLPYLCLDLVLAAAFWGYMHDGRRPNVYYRRRVRAG